MYYFLRWKFLKIIENRIWGKGEEVIVLGLVFLIVGGFVGDYCLCIIKI